MESFDYDRLPKDNNENMRRWLQQISMSSDVLGERSDFDSFGLYKYGVEVGRMAHAALSNIPCTRENVPIVIAGKYKYKYA